MPDKKLKSNNKSRKITRRTGQSRRKSRIRDDETRTRSHKDPYRDEVKEMYGGPGYYDEPPPPPSAYYHGPPPRRVARSDKPTVAGVLLILTGVAGLIFAAGSAFVGNLFVDIEEFMNIISEKDEVEIEGKIISEVGIPLNNVNVSIVDTELYSYTNETGSFIINNVPVGKQKIKIEKEGYNTVIYKAFIFPSKDSVISGFEDDVDKRANYYEIELKPGNQVIEDGEYPPFEFLSAVCFVCAVFSAIFSVFAIIGGYFAYTRKRFSIAIIGAILGIFSIGFVLGSIFAVVAIILLFMSRDEFRAQEMENRLHEDLYPPLK